MSSDQLVDRIYGYDDPCQFSEFIDENFDILPECNNKYFVAMWGENCQSKHIGDATIHGPFDSESEANDYR